MAEELIIRVKIDGYSSGGQGSTKGAGTTASGQSPLVGLAASPKSQSFGLKAERQMARSELKYVSSEDITGAIGDIKSLQKTKEGIFSDRYTIDMLDPDTGGVLTTANIRDYTKLRKGGMQLGKAAAWKAVSTAINITQHRSGDASYNAQLNNTVKLVGYGTSLAMAGPAAPFVALGIAGNEAFNAISQISNWKFDRRQEGNQIQNIKTIAGNVSYGRNRGSI